MRRTPPKRKKHPKRKRPLQGINSRGGLSRLKAQLDQVFSKYIRERDGCCVLAGRDAECSKTLQAGHLLSRRHMATRWDEMNVNAQCSAHNRYHNFHPDTYTRWFLEKYGLAAYTVLCETSRPPKKWSRTELEELIEFYQERLGRMGA